MDAPVSTCHSPPPPHHTSGYLSSERFGLVPFCGAVQVTSYCQLKGWMHDA